MHIQSFGSTEEMVEALRKQAEEAHRHLHPAQQSITWGTHWVQFHDIPNRHIIFGRVLTAEQIAHGAFHDSEGNAQEGVSWAEVEAVVKDTGSNLDRGFMYGWAYDRFNEVGELGITHKAHVWPIEERLFDMAKAAQWDIEGLDDAGRVLLEIAYRAMRSHVHSLIQKKGETSEA